MTSNTLYFVYTDCFYSLLSTYKSMSEDSHISFHCSFSRPLPELCFIFRAIKLQFVFLSYKTIISCSYRQDGFSNLSLISRHSDVTLKFPQICIECPFEDSFGGRIVIVALRWGRWQLLWGKMYTFWKEAEHPDDFKDWSASN